MFVEASLEIEVSLDIFLNTSLKIFLNTAKAFLDTSLEVSCELVFTPN